MRLALALGAARLADARVLALAALFGATAIGWNGVQLAEVARRAPRGQAGAVTGAPASSRSRASSWGPPLFALIASATGSYRVGFAVFAAVSGLRRRVDGGSAQMRDRFSDVSARDRSHGRFFG